MEEIIVPFSLEESVVRTAGGIHHIEGPVSHWRLTERLQINNVAELSSDQTGIIALAVAVL